MLPYFYSCGSGVVVAGCLRSQASGPKDLILKKSYQKGPYIWEEEKDNAGSCGAVSVPSPRSPELSFPEPGLRSSSSAMLWVATDPPYLTQISASLLCLAKASSQCPLASKCWNFKALPKSQTCFVQRKEEGFVVPSHLKVQMMSSRIPPHLSALSGKLLCFSRGEYSSRFKIILLQGNRSDQQIPIWKLVSYARHLHVCLNICGT